MNYECLDRSVVGGASFVDVRKIPHGEPCHSNSAEVVAESAAWLVLEDLGVLDTRPHTIDDWSSGLTTASESSLLGLISSLIGNPIFGESFFTSADV
ncbi:unnamed protein product [Lupinus luteus]|uniref:Uncharacterized protein n=1 Tax=Lupinus luteus TaxID=3873 RepID=A0AAV1WJ49_LUPLU